jgi:hypothetical protein
MSYVFELIGMIVTGLFMLTFSAAFVAYVYDRITMRRLLMEENLELLFINNDLRRKLREASNEPV